MVVSRPLASDASETGTSMQFIDVKRGSAPHMENCMTLIPFIGPSPITKWK